MCVPSMIGGVLAGAGGGGVAGWERTLSDRIFFVHDGQAHIFAEILGLGQMSITFAVESTCFESSKHTTSGGLFDCMDMFLWESTYLFMWSCS